MQDWTDNLISRLDAETRGRRVDYPPREEPSSDPKAALMYAKLVAHRTDEINSCPSGWSEISHALNSQAFAACLVYGIDSNATVSFDEASRPDEACPTFYATELMRAINLHQSSAMRFGLWRQYYDPVTDRFEIRLTRRRRRSALRALDASAQIDLLNTTLGKSGTEDAMTDDALFFALASSDEHLHFLRDADPSAWETFSKQAGFTTETLTAFAAFLVFLEFAAQKVAHSLWYDFAFLARLCSIFRQAWKHEALSDDVLRSLLEVFSLTPIESSSLSLPTPFFRIGDRYLRYHGFVNVMSPAMGLLTIAVRKNEKAWSESLGSVLSFGADALARSLPKFDRNVIAVRRRLPGGRGDIDVAIFDKISHGLLVCEVKTVYDKHRTVHQMDRFEEAKIGLSKATAQLRRSMSAVEDGTITMADIFGKPLPAPASLHGAVVNWLDSIDLTMETDSEDILSINFATLRYLLLLSDGNVDAMVTSIHELRNIWCVATLQPIDLNQPTIECELEVQHLDVLDSQRDLDSLNLSPLTAYILNEGAALDDDWRSAADHAKTVSYIDDSRRALRHEGCDRASPGIGFQGPR